MAITARRVVIRRAGATRPAAALSGALASALLACVPGALQAWEFIGRFDVGGAYTDNVELRADGLEESDWALWGRPDLQLVHESDRLKLSGRYVIDAYRYGDHDSSVVDQVFGELSSEIAPDLLFFDAQASHYQTSKNPEGRYSFGTLPVNANRVGVDRVDVRPYLRKTFGDGGELYASYLWGRLDYKDDAIQGSDRKFAQASVGNWNRESGLTVRLNYDLNRVEYEISEPFEYQKAYAEVGLWLGSSLRPFGIYGKESDFFDTSSRDMTEQSWEAGFEWVPSKKTYLLLAGGDRPWGNSYRATFRISGVKLSSEIGYREEPFTPGLDGYQQRPFAEDDNIQGALDETIERPGAAGRYVRKNAYWHLAYDLPKSRWSLRLYDTRREDIILDSGEPLAQQDEQDRGFTLAWSWEPGSRTTVRLQGTYARRQFATSDLEDTIWRAIADLEYALGSRTGVIFSLQHAEQDRNDSVLSGYAANTAYVRVRYDF